MKSLTLICMLFFTSCTAVYEEAKTVNDGTFAASILRVCGVTASLAAARKLHPDEQLKLQELCGLINARMMEQ